MKILIFFTIVVNLYAYISKRERYPREYSYYEKKKFEEISHSDKKKWPSDIKFIPASLIFGGTPKERLYIKKSIEEVNKIFKSVKTPVIGLIFEGDIHDHLPAWIGYPVSIEISPNIEELLDMAIVPNIKVWRSANIKTWEPILGKAGNSATHGLFGEPAKILIGVLTVYSNLITNEESDFYDYSHLDYERVHTFTHELMHTLGFGSHINSGESVMNSNISNGYIRSIGYTHGPMEWDVLFIEMKYNKLFETFEDEKSFREKLYNSKLRRPDKRSRREKLLNPIR